MPTLTWLVFLPLSTTPFMAPHTAVCVREPAVSTDSVLPETIRSDRLKRRFILRDARIADVIEKFNDHNHVPMHFEDADVGNHTVDGVLTWYDRQSFIDYLTRYHGIVARTAPDGSEVFLISSKIAQYKGPPPAAIPAHVSPVIGGTEIISAD